MTVAESTGQNGPPMTAALARGMLPRWLPAPCLQGATLWAGGAWFASAGTRFANSSPADGQSLPDMAEACAEDVDRAARAARTGAAAWWALDPSDRARLLRAVAAGLRRHADALGWLETLDSGRPLADTRGGPARAATMFEYYAGLAERISGRSLSTPAGRSATVDREPFGVIGAITAWNYPLGNAVTKLAPILACGNAAILKPAEQTPLVTLLLARIMEEAGLPAGTVNMLTGGAAAGEALVAHPLVGKISFTGSTEVGRRIAEQAGRRLKGTVLELGGKSPMLVFADADLELAAAAAVFTTFMNQGQTCTSCNRVLVAETVRDRFATLCAEKLARLRIGDPFDPETQIGAIVSAEQVARIHGILGDTRGRVLDLPHYAPSAGGHFVPPLIVEDAAPDSRVAREEIFGPVMTIRGFATEDEAFRLANDTEYGLAASAWTGSLQLAEAARRRLQAGVIWINCVHALPPGAPVSGHKASGMGSEYGQEAEEQYMRIKTTVTYAAGWRSPFEPAA